MFAMLLLSNNSTALAATLYYKDGTEVVGTTITILGDTIRLDTDGKRITANESEVLFDKIVIENRLTKKVLSSGQEFYFRKKETTDHNTYSIPSNATNTVSSNYNKADVGNAIMFRGMRWGSHPSDYKDLYSIGSVGSGIKQHYKKKNDKLVIGEAKLDVIHYIFFDDRLCSVYITFKKFSNFIKIHESFKQNYGNELKPNTFLENYMYCLNCETTVTLNYDRISDDGHIVYSYRPISDEIDLFNKSQARKSKNDL